MPRNDRPKAVRSLLQGLATTVLLATGGACAIAVAADAPAAKTEKQGVSPPLQKPLKAAQDLLTAKKFPEAIAGHARPHAVRRLHDQ
jgi:hypothetical protein